MFAINIAKTKVFALKTSKGNHHVDASVPSPESIVLKNRNSLILPGALPEELYL